jgi:hypothetical protein
MVTFFRTDPERVGLEYTAAVLRRHQLEDVVAASRTKPATPGWTGR